MKRHPLVYLLIPLSVLLQGSAAVLGKFASLTIERQSLTGLEAVLANPWYLGSLAFLGLQAIVWQIVLRTFPLAWAYFFNSLLYVFLLIAGVVFFAETVTSGNIIGTLLIITGIALLAKSNPKPDAGT